MSIDKCPHCGAAVESYGSAGPRYECGRIGTTDFGFHADCLRRQLTAANERAEKAERENADLRDNIDDWRTICEGLRVSTAKTNGDLSDYNRKLMDAIEAMAEGRLYVRPQGREWKAQDYHDRVLAQYRTTAADAALAGLDETRKDKTDG